MAREVAEVRGRVTVRPFRVGRLVDPTSAEAVRSAIVELSGVWGGMFMPLLDLTKPVDELDRLARAYDVDALYLGVMEGEVPDWLRDSGWAWEGMGPWGPFVSDGGFRNGLLPARLVGVERERLWVPQWNRDDELDLFYSAIFGAAAGVDQDVDPGTGGDEEDPAAGLHNVEVVGLGYLHANLGVSPSDTGIIQATRAGVGAERRYYMDGFTGVVVARPDHPEDMVTFWNIRSCGSPTVCVPAHGPLDVLEFLTRDPLPVRPNGAKSKDSDGPADLRAWGLDDASDQTRLVLEQLAARSAATLVGTPRTPVPRLPFPGLETRYQASIRGEFPSNGQTVTVRIPTLPLAPGAHQVMPGVVAVDVTIHSVDGLDPRLTSSVPPYRRHASLLRQVVRTTEVDQVRVSAEGEGFSFGQQASRDEIPIAFPFNTDAIRILFDDDRIKLSQSDVGRFQTRAAQMLGGPFGGTVLEPGLRAVIDKAAASTAGLTLQQLQAAVRNNKGEWPDSLFSREGDVDRYINRTVNYLLNSGLFIPMLDVHCSNCRVESQVSPGDLDALVTCEFCGEQFRLALSLSLSRSKSRWRYRLASHLGPDRVRALLPALAAMSMLGQIQGNGRREPSHMFGASFTLPGGKQVEADIAAYLGRPTWGLVLGEVKNNNRIDANDIANLEELQALLDAKSVRSMLMFVTLKDAFLETELEVLRALVERCGETTTAFASVVPRFPLVLTARDLSLPWSHDDHPWRWGEAGSGQGIYGTAEDSCRRNLGLETFVRPQELGRPVTDCLWNDPAEPAAPSADG